MKDTRLVASEPQESHLWDYKLLPPELTLSCGFWGLSLNPPTSKASLFPTEPPPPRTPIDPFCIFILVHCSLIGLLYLQQDSPLHFLGKTNKIKGGKLCLAVWLFSLAGSLTPVWRWYRAPLLSLSFTPRKLWCRKSQHLPTGAIWTALPQLPLRHHPSTFLLTDSDSRES